MSVAFGLTYHVEGPRDRPSRDIYAEITEQVRLADRLGFAYAWFAEHHDHAHYGHMPTPLLLALHLAGQTERIHLGTAIICLNLHRPLDIAEQVAVADTLTRGRIAAGFGSGSTPEEFALFGLSVTGPEERHSRFEEALRLMQAVWRGSVGEEEQRFFCVPPHAPLPVAAPDLTARSWLACNSVGASRIAGRLGFNMLFSHLRTPEQYREYRAAYLESGGKGLIAANRPAYVGADADSARRDVEPALRILWRRFQREGKIPADRPEPDTLEGLAGHPINFVFGDSAQVARQLRELHAQVPYSVANLEPRWAGFSPAQVQDSLHRLATETLPALNAAVGEPPPVA